MDTTALVIGFIMMLICIVPIMILNRSGAKAGKLYLKSLKDLAQKNETDIAEYDHWNDRAIGIDTEKNKIFFVRKSDFNEFSQQVNLDEIRKCRIIKTGVSDKDGKSGNVTKIELGLSSADNRKADTMVEFFNQEHGVLAYDDELQLAEKWNGIINGKINRD